jgi:ribosomal protein S18 acetylase RimI-like enzyme
MNTPFVTRVATRDDVPALVTLVNSAYRGDSSRAGWTTEADLIGGIRIDTERLLAATTHPDEHAILMHEDHGEVISCVHLQRTGHDCYLGMLTTLPARQGEGLGSRMMEASERFAITTWQARQMHMTVLVQRTDLIPYYERRGYVITGERKPFPYGDQRWGIPKRDDLAFFVMRKRLVV